MFGAFRYLEFGYRILYIYIYALKDYRYKIRVHNTPNPYSKYEDPYVTGF